MDRVQGRARSFTEPAVTYPEPRLLRVEEQTVVDLDLPGLDDGANNRRWHRGMRAERAFARKVTVPAGGGTPIHAVTCDHVIVQLSGSVSFWMNRQVYTLNPGDLFYFPANMLYSIRNDSGAESSFVSVGLEATFGWPPMSDYWLQADGGES